MANADALCDAGHFAQALDSFVLALETLCELLRR